MKLRKLSKAISVNYAEIEFTSPLQGSSPLTTGTPFGSNLFLLPSVSNNTYTTILSGSYKIEDVGNLEVIDIRLFVDFYYLGNGSIRCQLSGDGGNTWETCGQGNFNVAGWTFDAFLGDGMWIPSIQSGDNKYQFRLQTLANAGTVWIYVFDDIGTIIHYRKKVL